MTAYYNEIDPYAAQWLRNLISAGHIAPGDVDERSIVDVRPDDLAGYTQCHFFAGIGGWSYAARLAGFPDSRELWTGSCPCQPFSVAGKGEGQADERHLWPVFFDLIRARRPHVVMGEQVAAAVGKHWLDGVHSDLESIGYACGATVVPACAVNAPHRRDRLWFVADARQGRGQINELCAGRPEPGQCSKVDVADATGAGPFPCAHAGVHRQQEGPWTWDVQPERYGSSLADADEPSESEERKQRGRQFGGFGGNSTDCDVGNADHTRREEFRHGNLGQGASGAIEARPLSPGTSGGSHWAGSTITAGRRVEPSIRLLAHGVPARVGKLRAYGNAIVPQVAAEVIGAYLDLERAAA